MTKDIFHLELFESERRPTKSLASGFSILFKFEEEPFNRKRDTSTVRSSELEIHSNILVLPSSQVKEDREKSNVLYLTPIALDECALEYRLDPDELKRLMRDTKKIKKSIWIDQLLHRLVFEVNICNHTTSRAAVFCVLELVKEVYSLLH